MNKSNWVLLFIGVVLVLTSFWFDLMALELNHSWFQRSGSLLVIVGASMEAKYILQLPLTSLSFTRGDDRLLAKLQRHLGFFVILVGAAIWGYGDLLIQWLRSWAVLIQWLRSWAV